MNVAVALLISLVLLLSPLLAALPDEPLWSSWLSAGVMLAVVLAAILAQRGGRAFSARTSRAEGAFLVLLGVSFLSIPARMLIQHSTGFFGPMLHGWAILATDFALFVLARRVASDNFRLYGLVIAAVAGSAYVAQQGIVEYLPYFLTHQTSHRVFSTSTPDYLAGYLVLLIPVTLALALQLPAVKSLPPLLRRSPALILALVLLFQLIALLTTGSRFALLSLLVGLVIFGASLLMAARHGMVLDKATRGLLAVMGVVVVLAGAVFARPVLARLQNINDNSAAFRKWTWKGSVQMATANPVLGTGIGTWADIYPRYALTGFTRLAHNSYLQMADECGVPGLLALLATLGLLGVSLGRGLRLAPAAKIPAAPPPGRKGKQAAPVAAPSAGFLPADSRLLLCGLAGALAGGVVQNVIDSDWSVFFFGATFWTLAGLAAGVAAPAPAQNDASLSAPQPVTLAVGVVAAALCASLAAQGIAAGYAAQAAALTAIDPQSAAQLYGAARVWDPLNGHYASDQGYKVYYLRGGNLSDAETALRAAIALEPDSVNYRRLGNVLQNGGRQSESLKAYREGLRAEPSSLELLLDLARLSPAPVNLDYYRRLSDLELTPVGTVPALGESTETRFAFGDAAMGDEAAKSQPAQAADYYARAAKRLEAFADEGGSLNEQRQAMSGSHADPHLDADMRGLYRHVLDGWIALAPEDISLRKRRQTYLQRFDAVFAKSSAQGNTQE